MPEAWTTNTMKSIIRVWLTARERAIIAGQEFVEMVEDLVEEVRHEQALEAQQRQAAPAPAPPAPAPAPPAATPRRRASAPTSGESQPPSPVRTRRKPASPGTVDAGEAATPMAKAPRRTRAVGAAPRRPRKAAPSPIETPPGETPDSASVAQVGVTPPEAGLRADSGAVPESPAVAAGQGVSTEGVAPTPPLPEDAPTDAPPVVRREASA